MNGRSQLSVLPCLVQKDQTLEFAVALFRWLIVACEVNFQLGRGRRAHAEIFQFVASVGASSNLQTVFPVCDLGDGGFVLIWGRTIAAVATGRDVV